MMDCPLTGKAGRLAGFFCQPFLPHCPGFSLTCRRLEILTIQQTLPICPTVPGVAEHFVQFLPDAVESSSVTTWMFTSSAIVVSLFLLSISCQHAHRCHQIIFGTVGDSTGRHPFLRRRQDQTHPTWRRPAVVDR